MLSEVEKVTEAIAELRKQKIQLAIDDMGGGSVSLREAALLMPDYVKFDRSLIRDIGNDKMKQKIILSLMLFAKGIKAKTTAEGIETKSEMSYLKRIGIEYGQGYLIAKPWKIGFAERPKEVQKG